MYVSDRAPATSLEPRVRIVPRRAPLPPAALTTFERELKYQIPVRHEAFVRARLRSTCRPDPVYSPARVVTVYFDTADLALLDEKLNSDYVKTKLRVRWYEGLDGGFAGDGVFLECKCRVGATRQKVRVKADRSASDVSTWALDAPAWRRLLEPLRLEGIDVPADLLPVMQLSYLRERLSDPLEGGRLTFDTHVVVDRVNPLRLRPGLAGPLPAAILEYKSARADLPPYLRFVSRAGARKVSFSKYLAAYAHVTQCAL